jgi:uncharacterized membrane protein YqiK
VRLQRLLRAGQFAGIDVVLGAEVVAMGLGVAAPLVVVGRHLDRAVALPALGVSGRQRGDHIVIDGATGFAGVLGGGRHRHLGFPVAQRHRGVELRQAKILGRQGVFRYLEKRVVVQHLVDFLAELQRRQLQQPDGLLQLGRERQMLGDAER